MLNAKDGVLRFLEDLKDAKRPVLIIGGGCRNYKKEFLELMEALRIPCFPTWNALDIVTSDLFYYGGRIGTYGGAGRNFAIQNSDLMLCIGSRISGRITGGLPETFAPEARKYFVDVDQHLLNPKYQPVQADVNILSDAGEFMKLLTKQIGDRHLSLNFQWRDQVKKWRRWYDPVKLEHFEKFHHYGFMRKLSEKIPDNAIITADTGGNVITFAHAFETKQGQTYFTNNGNTPMGFSLAAAIGAWFACPDRPIICFIGDGGLQMNIQELQTVVHYKVPVKIFVLNNHILGNTKAYINKNLEGRAIACDLEGGYSCPDFMKVSSAYGIIPFKIENWEDFNLCIPAILDWDMPVLVDVVHHDFCDYAPKMVSWDKPIHDMEPYLSREEFNANNEACR